MMLCKNRSTWRKDFASIWSASNDRKAGLARSTPCSSHDQSANPPKNLWPGTRETPQRRDLRRTGGMQRISSIGNLGMMRLNIHPPDHFQPVSYTHLRAHETRH